MKKSLLIILIIVNVIMIGRLSFLCIYKNDYYLNILKENNNRIIEGMTAPRGRILDVNGHILVDNIGVKTIIYNKLNIGSSEELEVVKILAEHLELNFKVSDYDIRYYYYQTKRDLIDARPPAEVVRKYNERKLSNQDLLEVKLSLITDEELAAVDRKAAYLYYLMNNGYSYQDKIIKTNISDEEYILINSLNLAGIRTDITWERVYPYGEVLKDVFGLVSGYDQGLTAELKDEYLAQGYALNDRVGLTNLEYLYDQYLRGTKATYQVTNNQLTLVSDYIRGKDLVLAIDIEMQMMVEKELEAEMINAKKAPNSSFFSESYIVVSNPNDGSVMALVGKKIKSDNTFTNYAYYNVMNAYNVGSVVKGASISVGYKNNLIDEKTKVVDSCITLYGGKAKCSWSSLGTINDIRALQWSSNYFQYLIAIKLTGNKPKKNLVMHANLEHFNEYREVFKAYGLGNMTGIDLTKETTGMKSSTITDDLLLLMAIGQYDTYTPVALAQYINTIAVGERMQLHLLKQVLNNDGSVFYEYEAQSLNQAPIEEKYLKRIREGFKAVNAAGTGYGHTNHKFTSAGKTGTSDTYFDSDLDGTIDTFTQSSSFVMYAPYENPEVSIAMISPHIGQKKKGNSYRYPINAKVAKKISAFIMSE